MHFLCSFNTVCAESLGIYDNFASWLRLTARVPSVARNFAWKTMDNRKSALKWIKSLSKMFVINYSTGIQEEIHIGDSIGKVRVAHFLLNFFFAIAQPTNWKQEVVRKK